MQVGCYAIQTAAAPQIPGCSLCLCAAVVQFAAVIKVEEALSKLPLLALRANAALVASKSGSPLFWLP